MTLTYFTARSTLVAHAFEWEKLLKCHLKGKSCRKWANGLKVGNSEKNVDPRGWSAPDPGQYTWNGEGGINVFINNPGHMTKMAAMPIYGKNLLKFFFC